MLYRVFLRKENREAWSASNGGLTIRYAAAKVEFDRAVRIVRFWDRFGWTGYILEARP